MFRSKPKVFNEKTINKIFLIKQFIFNGIDVFGEVKTEHQFNMKQNQLKWRFPRINKKYQEKITYSLPIEEFGSSNQRQMIKDMLYKYY